MSTPGDKVQIATSGVITAIVSDLGGQIRAGDPVTVSPIRGVGMKASVPARIIGTAQKPAIFGDKTADVTATGGAITKAKLGTVQVAVQVSFYTPPAEKSVIPKWLQLYTNTLAGKDVPLIRVVISSLIVLAALIAVIVLLFSAVRNTMVSIGRNPLAKTSIYRGLWQIVATSVLIFLAAMGAAYLVLTR